MNNIETRNMELNDAKNVFLQKMETEYVPFYIKYFENLPILSKFPKLLQYILIGSTPCIGLLILSKVGIVSLNFTIVWIVLNLSATTIVALALLSIAYKKTYYSLTEVLNLLSKTDQIKKLEFYIELMFISKYQLIFCISFTLILISMVIIMNISLPFISKIYFTVVAIFALFVAGPGLWLALTSAYFISQLKHLGDLTLNAVYPNKTPGLKKLSSLLTTFSLFFSLEVFLFLIAFFLAPWANTEMHLLFTRIVASPIIFFMMFFFVHPQIRIRNVVISKKEKMLSGIESRIRSICSKERYTPEDLELIRGLTELYKDLDSSASMVLNLSILIRFISSIAFPLAFIIKEDPYIIPKVIDMLLK